MRLTFPHIGTAYVAISAMLKSVGVDYVVPPFSSHRTLSLGVRYSPEFVCLPYKLVMGNIIEGLEAGADTVLMIEGAGLCRLGNYASAMEKALRDLGYDFKMITTRLFEGRIFGIPKLLKRISGGAPTAQILSGIRFALSKLNALDTVEIEVQRIRARERAQGSADQAWRQAISDIDEADTVEEVHRARDAALAKLAEIPQNGSLDPLRVAIVGEIFVVLDPFVNMDVEKELGRLGVEVHRTILLSDWTRSSLILAPFGYSQHKEAHEAAMPYLKRDVGGDGWESVGDTVVHANEGFDGVFHLTPFTCMPEIIAQNIMPKVMQDTQIPVLTITCDEQMGRQGVITRVEAFVDLMRRKREESRRRLARIET